METRFSNVVVLPCRFVIVYLVYNSAINAMNSKSNSNYDSEREPYSLFIVLLPQFCFQVSWYPVWECFS